MPEYHKPEKAAEVCIFTIQALSVGGHILRVDECLESIKSIFSQQGPLITDLSDAASLIESIVEVKVTRNELPTKYRALDTLLSLCNISTQHGTNESLSSAILLIFTDFIRNEPSEIPIKLKVNRTF